MSTRLIMFFISLLSLVFIVSLSRSIYSLWQKGDLVAEREAVRLAREQENQTLKEKLTTIQSQEFIEREAREKLNLAREGEIIVVLPKDLESPVASVSSVTQIPPWRQWWQLFF